MTVPGLRDSPGISSYFPRVVLRQNGLSCRVVDAIALPDLIARGELQGEPLFFYRGLGWSWLEFHALEAGPEAEPGDRERSREVLAATRLGLAGLQTEVIARHRIVRQNSPVPEYRMDFNALPGPWVDIEMVRLYSDSCFALFTGCGWPSSSGAAVLGVFRLNVLPVRLRQRTPPLLAAARRLLTLASAKRAKHESD